MNTSSSLYSSRQLNEIRASLQSHVDRLSAASPPLLPSSPYSHHRSPMQMSPARDTLNSLYDSRRYEARTVTSSTSPPQRDSGMLFSPRSNLHSSSQQQTQSASTSSLLLMSPSAEAVVRHQSISALESERNWWRTRCAELSVEREQLMEASHRQAQQHQEEVEQLLQLTGLLLDIAETLMTKE